MFGTSITYELNIIKNLTDQITSLGGKPSLDQSDQKLLIKNLTKQLETLSVNSILNDKTKNKIHDEVINGTKIRFQNIEGLPPKELRKLVDNGKKDLGEGIVVVFAFKAKLTKPDRKVEMPASHLHWIYTKKTKPNCPFNIV